MSIPGSARFAESAAATAAGAAAGAADTATDPARAKTGKEIITYRLKRMARHPYYSNNYMT